MRCIYHDVILPLLFYGCVIYTFDRCNNVEENRIQNIVFIRYTLLRCKFFATGNDICRVNTKLVNYKYVQSKSCLLWTTNNYASFMRRADVAHETCLPWTDVERNCIFNALFRICMDLVRYSCIITKRSRIEGILVNG